MDVKKNKNPYQNGKGLSIASAILGVYGIGLNAKPGVSFRITAWLSGRKLFTVKFSGT